MPSPSPVLDSESPERVPVLIAGGGLAGLTMASMLGAAGLPCLVLDRAPPAAPEKDDQDADPRASAIALGSVGALTQAGAWAHVADHAQPILDILVTDEESPARVHFPAALAGADAMGYMVENRRLLGALRAAVRGHASVTWRAGASVIALETTPAGAAVTYRTEQGERTIRAETALIADGRASALRAMLGVKTDRHDYRQTALICAMSHALPHRGLAQERFLPDGPFATLPLRDPLRSSIVWTAAREDGAGYLALSDAEFNAELQHRAGRLLGEVTGSSHRGAFPLTLASARTYRQGPYLLIGDAAHGVHPLAGQGYNLSVRGCAALAELLTKARRQGRPLNDPELGREYERARRADAYGMIFATHGLNALFSSAAPPLKLARRAGLALTDRLPGVKKLLMRRAMGVI